MITILDSLKKSAAENGASPAFTFISDSGAEESITPRQLYEAAIEIARSLRRNVEQGERVVLLLPQGLEYIKAFFGCLYAGAIAVPLYPPSRSNHSNRISSVVNDCDAKLAITTRALFENVKNCFDEKSQFNILTIDDGTSIEAVDFSWSPSSETIAFLQYTSGSTGKPKGVMVSHSNIIANLEALIEATDCQSEDTFCNWLPLFHDLGLINTLMLPVYLAAHSVLMSPAHFIKRPIRWFEAISKYEATICGAPNFAYEHCIDKVKLSEESKLDLSSWRVAFNAAEPINPDALREFVDRFSSIGFHKKALYPAYGMAEATVFISGIDPNKGFLSSSFDKHKLYQNIVDKRVVDIDSVELVSCGYVQSKHDVKIVTPNTNTVLPDGNVGEILFSGPSVAQGYWNNVAKTSEVFEQVLDKPNGLSYLRTGDLGFLHEGQLYISGRIKDVIIVKGRNYYPNDLEVLSNQSYPGLKKAGAVAFEVNGTVRIVQEVERRSIKEFDSHAAISAIKSRIFEEHELLVSDIVFIKSGELPKTSSGKVQRALTKSRYTCSELNVLFRRSKRDSDRQHLCPETKMEIYLANQWSVLLEVEDISKNDNFFELGGQSITVAKLISTIKADLFLEISVRNLFEHPTLSDMAVFLQTHEINKQQNIQVMTGSAVSVLTTIQKQMLFIDHLNSGSSQYNLMASFKINGVLQIDCLKEALKTLIQRHKALRTIFVNTDGNMYAQLKGGYDFKLQTHDLTTLDLSDQFVAKEIEKLVKHDFDLTSDLLMKGVLFKTGGKHFILTLLFHHIAVDGWSLGLLTKELSELYNAYVCGLSLELPTESVEYADFANWQANWLTSNQFDEQKEYWIKKLKDVPNVHNLPLDRTRPVEQSHMGEKVLQRLNSDMKDEIMHFANEYGATLFMVLNAAFSSLLHRYSNENDIVVGTAVANRDKVEFSQVVGCFVNSLALRSQFSSDLSFTEHLQNTKETLLEAYDNQQFPFERLVEEINPERSLSYSPIFQIMLVLQNNENSSLKMQNVDVEQLDRTSVLSTFDLTLNVNEDETGLNLSWEFSTDVFDAATIERMAHHFENLLGSILACPNQKISKLNLLSENESDKLLNYWAGSEQDFPAGECIHDEIERHASICPNSIALIHEDRSLAYAELNQRANRLARHLISKGVKPDCLIGLFIKPSLEMVVGMLAIVKAGGAYLILDPSYPKERIGHLIDDSKVNIILSVTGLAEHPLLTKQEVELLDEERFDKSLEEYPSTNISREEADLCDSNVIYATYTSGSTGRPKGVLVQHKGLSNFVRDHTQRLSISNQSNVLQFGTVSFDGPASTIWLALFAGAKLCIGDNLEQQIDTELPLFIERNNVTHITMTPSALAGLRYIECIETVWVGGEVCPPSLVSYWKDKVKLFNVYGPSEATICSTVKNLNNTGRVTIGKPISNVFTFVLDNNLNPVPTGVAGELFIGGAGVSKGYMNHPALTLEKFIPNHLSKKNDDRLYKTGDLVRWSRDGELEYLGRLDNQVKIRGFRVELGEIEKAITELDFISEAIVSVLGESKKLVAYVISHDKKLISKSKLIQSIVEHLHLTLPDYMVPVAFSLLDNFPLTPNGKIDYKSLPEPKTNCDSSYRAPSTLNERLLCEIWQDLLQISKIGVNDNFFRLGGDSILAIQVVSRANQKGIYVTTKQLFENQTIFELALMSKSENRILSSQAEVIGSQKLIPIQQDFLFSAKSDKHHFNQSILLHTPTEFEENDLLAIVGALYERHDGLRQRFTLEANEWSSFYLESSTDIVEQSVTTHDLVGLNDEQIEEAMSSIERIEQSQLSLSKGPLFRAVLFKCGEGNSRLLLILHHLLVDGVSWRILLKDLELSYGNVKANRTIELDAKTSSYQLWGETLNEYSKNKELLEEVPYWLNQMSGEYLALLSDNISSQKNELCLTETVSISLDQKMTQALLNDCSFAYNTKISELLLTAVFMALREWTGSSTTLIDIEGHGREPLVNNIDLSQTIGWFTSLYPLKINNLFSESISEVIKHIKESARNVPNNGIGFGVLTCLLKNPLIIAAKNENKAQILFNYLGQFDQAINENSEFQLVQGFTGSNVSERYKSDYALSINGMILKGCLTFALDYRSTEYTSSTMKKFANGMKRQLQKVIEHCKNIKVTRHTPVDFPLTEVSQNEISKLEKSYPKLINIYDSTPMQKGMLFHSQLNKCAYVSQVAPKILGELDVNAFKASWETVIDRHDIFRTAFVGEEAKQLVLSDVSVPWLEEDWRIYPLNKHADLFEQYRTQDKQLGFEVAKAPLMRLTLLRLTNDSFRLLWTTHHSLMDGWSLPIVFDEVMSTYRQLIDDIEFNLAPVPKYIDYIEWLAKQDRTIADEFWLNNLQGIESPTSLGCEKRSNNYSTIESNVAEIVLSETRTKRLAEFAKNKNITLNTIVQCAWAYLLHRYSGETKVVFGETVSGRPATLPSVENMVGVFINSLPVVVDFDREDTISDWLVRMHEASLNRNEFSYLSLPEILQLSPLPNNVALFDTLVVFENYPMDKLFKDRDRVDNGFAIEDVFTDIQNNFNLTLCVIPNDSLKIIAKYRSEVYDKATIVRLLQQMEVILTSIVDEQFTGVNELPLLTSTDSRKLLKEWSQTKSDSSNLRCIHRIFEEQVKITPNNVAVVDGELTLTYEQLNRKANRLAHHLAEDDIGPGDFVGIYAERSIELMISLIGVMKSGAAYIPMDPKGKTERMSHLIQDANIEIVITQASLMQNLPVAGIDVLLLDDAISEDWLDEYESSNPSVDVSIEDNIYVIYTSGTTGLPKGVQVTHSGVSDYCNFAANSYYEKDLNGSLVVTSHCFDITVPALYMPIVSGGIVDLSVDDDLENLGNRLCHQTHKRYLLRMTPMHVKGFLSLVSSDPVNARHIFVIGGESFSSEIAKELQAKFPQSQIYNHYGPTETVVGCSLYNYTQNGDGNGVSLPIGKPMDNTQLYVLDDFMRPQSIGAVGELYIGGLCVSSGYLNQPKLTAEKFLESPLVEGQKLYKSGDLVRWLPCGNLEFISRRDHQVKIRGFRIELGEIENIITHHPLIKNSVVIANLKSQQLIAYVEVDTQDAIEKQLKQFLKQKLPDYMVPASFVTLDKIPLSANGKIDRGALPEPDLGGAIKSSLIEPTNETEHKLCALWQELLNVERVGIDDNFLELGGHSLLATKLVSEIRSRWHVSISIKSIFDNSTVRELARHIDDFEKEVKKDNIINRFDIADSEVEEFEL